MKICSIDAHASHATVDRLLAVENEAFGVSSGHRSIAYVAIAMYRKDAAGAQLFDTVEIKGSAIGPAAQGTRKRSNHSLAGAIIMARLRHRHGEFEYSRSAYVANELLQPLVAKPKVGRLTTPVTEQKLHAAILDRNWI
ncbi:hypothetical protein [Bradyrhizobium sp. 170]|uniref:hypothetical protein n=1 Tax=Bradyrhizobium sp. 170 TaxID=2782641 RepID=UPI0020004C2A|nr:hypothetical protein [Bradyrhizobium sp. 170]UPK06258.1 hypothetical protein IVB05_12330 [Bradyrhizobium sp. 170]